MRPRSAHHSRKGDPNMIVHCEGCGEECTNAYCTYNGYAYHITCIPARKVHQSTILRPSMMRAKSREQVLAKELENMGIGLREAIQRAERCESREMIWHDALTWYAEKATAAHRYMTSNPTKADAMIALLT